MILVEGVSAGDLLFSLNYRWYFTNAPCASFFSECRLRRREKIRKLRGHP
jgi:hypothetical protein